MALEHDIQELTDTIKYLIAELKSVNTVAATWAALPGNKEFAPAQGVIGSENKQGTIELKKVSEEKKDKAATTPKSSQASAPTIESSSDESESPVIEYAALQTAVLDVSKKSRATPKDSREQAVALLARFGVAGISKLLPEQYADVMALCPKIMSGELDMTAAIVED